MNITINEKICFSFVLMFSIVMPTFHNYLDSVGVLLVNGTIIIFLFFYLVLKDGFCLPFICKSHRVNAFRYLIPMVVMLLIIPFSMFIGVFFGGVNLIERDFYELYKPVFYIFTFLFSFFFFSKLENIKTFELLLLIVFFVVVFFGLNHYFRVFDFITVFYTKTHNIESMRVSTPFVNPYDYAFFMTFFVYYFFMKLLFYKITYIPFFVISIFMFILPQSRSVMVGFLVGFFLIMPFILSYTGFKIKTLKIKKRLFYFYIIFFFFLFLVISAIPYLIENFRYLTGQFIRLVESGDIGNSAGIRLEQFMFALGKAISNPLILLFGNGPAKDEMEHVESIYNYLFYRYGLIGVSFYFFLLYFAAFQTWKIVQALSLDSKYYSLFYAILLWLLTIPLFSIGNNFTEQVRLSFFYYTLLGLVSASYYKLVIKGGKG